MRKITKNLLSKHDSYISALEEAIQEWRKPNEKESHYKNYMLAIGEIGREIHKMNLALDIPNMKCVS